MLIIIKKRYNLVDSKILGFDVSDKQETEAA